MVSIHSYKAYEKAESKGAAAAGTYETWAALDKFSKRELAEIAMHLAAVCSDECDDALFDGRALGRIIEEHTALKRAGIL